LENNVFTDCPFCLTRSTYFAVTNFRFVDGKWRANKPAGATHEAVGRCGTCDSSIALFFFANRYGASANDLSLGGSAGNLNDIYFVANGYNLTYLSSIPSAPTAEAPEYAPDNITRAFIDADKARLAGAFSAAAGGYRKAVDRAVTPFVDQELKSKMLGPKLGNLEGKALLSTVMLDWIRVLKDDGNFALHDDDRDYDTAAEVEPARLFAWGLISYLYTIPKRVEIARQKAEDREAAD
jgi:hypothetical protein